VIELLGLFRRTHRPDAELLSAHLDGRLDAVAAARAEAHIASCEACRVRLAELRTMRDMLRSLPDADAPRSFRLRPSDVPSPVVTRRAPGAVRAMPMLGAVAAVVFAAVLGFDLSRSGGSTQGTASLTASQPVAAAARTTEEYAAQNGAAAPAPKGALDATSPSAASDSQSGGAAAAPTAGEPSARSMTSADAASGVEPPSPLTPRSLAAATPPVLGQFSTSPEPGSSPITSSALTNEEAGGAVPPAPDAFNPPMPQGAATLSVPTLPSEGQLAAAPATPAFQAAADDAASDASGGGSDGAYRIAEAVSAAVALIALGTVIIWRARRREV
jgi:anti-sigma factor RsiW